MYSMWTDSHKNFTTNVDTSYPGSANTMAKVGAHTGSCSYTCSRACSVAMTTRRLGLQACRAPTQALCHGRNKHSKPSVRVNTGYNRYPTQP